MGKKKRDAAGKELLEARVLRERTWMHARWMERLTFHQISALAARPVEAGGLGINVSPQGCKVMVQTRREELGDISIGREERRERQSDEVDMRARAARADLDDAYAALAQAKAALAADPDADPSERVAHWKAIEVAQKVIETADRRLAASQKDERDLHGLTAAAEVKLDVVHHEAILEELSAELARFDVEVGS